jgi:PAS domain S-box-containing protein
MASPAHTRCVPPAPAAFRVLDALEDAILIVGSDGRVAWLNGACSAYFGISAGSAAGIDVSAFFDRFVVPLAPAETFDDRTVSALACGSGVWCCRFRISEDGVPERWVSASGRSMEDERFPGYRMLRFRELTGSDQAGFPAEIQSPVMHVAEDGEILSANAAAAPLLVHWNVAAGDRLPDSWIPMLRSVRESGSAERIDVATETGIYALTFAPARDGESIVVSGTGIGRGGGDRDLPGIEYRYRELFNSMKSGVAVYEARADGHAFVFRDFNLAAERMDGVTRSEVVGKRLMEVYPGAKAFGIVDALRRVWRTGEPELLPVRLYQDDRLVRWRDNYIYRLPSGELVAVFDDRTAQVRAENALKESERMFRGIAQRSFDMIFTLDATGKIIYVSPAVMRVLGYEPSASIGRMCRDRIAPQHHDRYSAATARLLEGRDVEGLIFEVIRSDGSTAHMEINASPIVREGSVTGIQGVARDITDRVMTEQAKKHAYDRIGRNIEQFAILGDHIRQPLQVLLGTADLAGEEWSGTITEQVERINSIISELDQGWIESRKVREFLKRYE